LVCQYPNAILGEDDFYRLQFQIKTRGQVMAKIFIKIPDAPETLTSSNKEPAIAASAIYAHKLETIELGPDVPVKIISQEKSDEVSLDDLAIKAMTDFKKVRAITISPESSIDYALQLMKHAGVKLLLVIGDDDILAGLITARDIMGEKPLSIITKEQIKREEIQVAQVMTPRAELNPFNFYDIEYATIRDAILKLREVGRHHALVVEQQKDSNDYYARGIFSITQIGRQLGMEISSDGHVQNFSEFEKLFAEDLLESSKF